MKRCDFVCEDFPQENQTLQKSNTLYLSTNLAFFYKRCCGTYFILFGMLSFPLVQLELNKVLKIPT